MRNLKKFLALVLAMMMVFSLMVTVNAANTTAAFPDSNEVSTDYKEALDVMVALGIINGRTNGNLDPNGKFIRMELATLMYFVRTGDVKSTDYRLAFAASTSYFTDVNSSNVQAKYVNFCYEQGWVSGVGNNKFNPNGTVKTYEVLLSMLNVLGLGDEVNASNYILDTVNVAHKYGIDAGLTSYTDDATRQVAAQIFFNAMAYSASGEKIWTVKDRYGNPKPFDSEIMALLFLQTELNSNADPNLAEWVGAENSLKGSLLADVHGVEKVSGTTDVFERPTTEYRKNGATLVSVAKTPDGYFNGTFTGKDAKALNNGKTIATMGSIAGTVSTRNIYYNGGVVNNTSDIEFLPNSNGTTTGTTSAKGLWWNETAGIPGYEVFVYNTTTGYNVIVREAYVGKITAISAATGDIELTIYDNAGSIFAYDISDTDDLYEELSAYAKDAYLAVYAKPGWEAHGKTNDNDLSYVLEIDPLTKKEVQIRWISDNGYRANSTITIETLTGPKYTINNEAMVLNGVAATIPTALVMERQGTRNITVGKAVLYTLNGSVLLIDQSTAAAAADTGYGYVMDYKANVNGVGDEQWETEGGHYDPSATSNWVKIYTPEGVVKTLQLDTATALRFNGYYDYANAATNGDIPWVENADARYDWLGQLVYYSRNGSLLGNPAYNLTRIDSHKAAEGNDLKITNSKSEAKVPSANWFQGHTAGYASGATTPLNVAFDSATRFIVVSTQYVGKDTLTPNTAGKNPIYGTTEDATAETFIRVYDIYNVPNFDTSNVYVSYAAPLDNSGNLVSGGNVAANGIARVVLIRDAGVSTTNGYYFVAENGFETIEKILLDDGTIVEYCEYPAVIDGTLTKVKVAYRVIDSKGVVTSTGPAYTWRDGNGDTHFFKNPSVKTYAPGYDIINSISAANILPNSVDSYAIKATALTEAANDHVKLTVVDEVNGGTSKEDFLVSVTTRNGGVFRYDTTKGTIEKIAVNDLKDIDPAIAPNYVFALRTTDHNVVSALFVPVS